MLQQIMGVTIPTGNFQDPKKITLQQYQEWKKIVVFDVLKGEHTGRNFCNCFGIADAFMYYNVVSFDHLDQYIRENYLQ